MSANERLKLIDEVLDATNDLRRDIENRISQYENKISEIKRQAEKQQNMELEEQAKTEDSRLCVLCKDRKEVAA